MRLTATLIGLTAAAAVADIEVHQIEYAWNVLDGNAPSTFDVPLFDSMGGARELTGVNVALDGSLMLDMSAENQEEEAVSEGSWFVESGVFMQLAFDTLDLGFLTGVGLGVYSADLGANDAVKGSGPDFTSWSYDESVAGGADILDGDLGAFEGAGVMSAELYPFLSLALSAPPPLVFVDVVGHEHTGALTLTYEYTPVPAPGALTVGAIGLVALRRRR